MSITPFKFRNILMFVGVLSSAILPACKSTPTTPDDGSGIVSTVTVTGGANSIVVAGTTQLTAITKNSSGTTLTGKSVNWSVAPAGIVQVNGSGLVTAIAPGGPVTVTATSEGKNGTFTITVTAAIIPVASVEVTGPVNSIIVNNTVQLNAKAKAANGTELTGRTVVWATANGAIATVSQNGLVTGVASGGPINITATSEGIVGSYAVTVTPIPVATVTVSPTSAVIGVGGSQTFVATTKDVGGNTLTGRSVVWSTSHPALTTVAQNGTITVTAVGGPVTITATSETKTGTADLTAAFGLNNISAAGGNQTCGVSGTTAYCWGTNINGQVGDGTGTGSRSLPTPVAGGLLFSSTSAGSNLSCGIATNGNAYCWGTNSSGQIGDNSGGQRNSPSLVFGGRTWTNISAYTHVCAVATGGAAYCWGNGSQGQLGAEGLVLANVPVPVDGGLTFVQVVTGSGHSCGRTAAGVAYCWGGNGAGQLGDGTLAAKNVPTPVSGGLTFTFLTSGDSYVCGVATGGAAYCWGGNGNGQLGDGTLTNRSVPTPVAGGRLYTSLAGSVAHTCGVTTAGAGFCWGFGNAGRLGNNDVVDQLTPVAVLGGLTFTRIIASGAATCGIANTFAVYCWGGNGSGELGDGTLVSKSVPTLVKNPL